MNNRIARNQVMLFLTIIIIVFFFYLLNLFTPENTDDYIYKFYFHDGHVDTTTRIKKIADIIHSQICHYQIWNGRSFVHAIVQLFTGIIGKNIFNPINTFVFLSFLLLLCKCGHCKITASSILVCLLFSLLFMPAFGVCFLMMTGSINYLWASVAILVFLLLLENRQNKPIAFSSITLVFVGILCGWTHEGITAPLSIGVFAYAIIYKRVFFKKETSILCLGFFIGVLMCALSPGTLGRAQIGEEANSTVLFMKLLSGITVMGKMRLFYILVFLLAIGKMQGIINIKKWIKNNILLTGGMIGSLGLIMLSGFTSSRAGIGLELFSMILIIKILPQLMQVLFSRRAAYPLFIISTILMAAMTFYNFKNYKEYKSLISQITQTDNYIIETQQANVPPFFTRFIVRPIDDEGGEYDNNFWDKGYNPVISSYFNRDSLIFLPSRFISDLNSNNYITFSDGDKLPFYAKRISAEEYEKEIKKITFNLRDAEKDDIPIFYRPFANKLNRYAASSIDAQKYTKVNIRGNYYLLVSKNSNIDWRVQNLIIKYE